MSGAQDWHTPETSLTLPPFAGPGQARIFIGPDIPPPLLGYAFTDRAGYTGTYSSVIIFYNTDTTPPVDETWSYIGVVDNGFGVFSAVHFGHVQNGAVREISAGVPMVQIWGTEGSSIGTQKWLSAGTVGIEALAATGQMILRGFNGVNINNMANGQNIGISATGGTAAVNLTSAGPIDFNAGTQLQIQGIKAWMTTFLDTLRCSAPLTPVPAVYTNVPGLFLNVTTITTNALYKVDVACDIGMNPAGGPTAIMVQLLVDGVAQAQNIVDYLAAVKRDTESNFWSGTLAAPGLHAFQVRAIDSFASGVCDIDFIHSTLRIEIMESGG